MDRYGDLRKNGSGYTDPTPYQALTGMYNPGEIWTHTNSGNEVLILKDHDGFCTVLRLVDEEGKAGCISVVSRALKYTHPGMVQYVFNTQLGMMVKKLPDDEFKAVQEAVFNALTPYKMEPIEARWAPKKQNPTELFEKRTCILDEEVFKRTMKIVAESYQEAANAMKALTDILESGDGR